jgi:hypothetical protein
MKPRRTLLVVINKKVEWGILSVAAISGYTVGRPEGDGVGRLRRAGQGAGLSAARAGPSCRLYGWPPRAPASASPVICACWANPILLDQLSPSALRLPRADGVLTGQRIFVDFAVPHDNAKISVGFFEGPDVFQGIAIGESVKQCD